jgi:hypothetical protein
MTSSTHARSTISTSEATAGRARRVDEVVHSARMEGLDVTPAWAADAVAGRISTEEFGARTRARYGLEI